MLEIKQFRYGSDNFAYVLHGRREAIVIDGGAADAITIFLKAKNLRCVLITNTHSHHDHTSGNEDLKKTLLADCFPSSDFEDHDPIFIEEDIVRVYQTPGHTDDSVCFHTGDILITGDTLFNGTIGNCFSGNQKFYLSIKRILSLPDETKIYAGHDYVLDSLAFAQNLEPDNPHIEIFRARYSTRKEVFPILPKKRRSTLTYGSMIQISSIF